MRYGEVVNRIELSMARSVIPVDRSVIAASISRRCPSGNQILGFKEIIFCFVIENCRAPSFICNERNIEEVSSVKFNYKPQKAALRKWGNGFSSLTASSRTITVNRRRS